MEECAAPRYSAQFLGGVRGRYGWLAVPDASARVLSEESRTVLTEGSTLNSISRSA